MSGASGERVGGGERVGSGERDRAWGGRWRTGAAIRAPTALELGTAHLARSIYWQLIWIYVKGTTVATTLTFLLILIGLDYTALQWGLALAVSPLGILAFLAGDIPLMNRHFRPLKTALERLDRGETLDRPTASAALARALNLPFYSFLRVTFVHGPVGAISLIILLLLLNLFWDIGYQAWQILTFAFIVFVFASPAHAIFEFFSISRVLVPVVERLSTISGEVLPEHQRELVAIRLRNKLQYLAIFVTALPLLFFAASVVFKVDLMLQNLGIVAPFKEMRPLLGWVAAVSLISMVGAIAMASLTANEVSRSAARLGDAMKQVESGNLGVHLPITSTDEYADLFRGFNLMVDGLRDEVRILEVTHALAGELKLDALIARIMRATTELLDADRSTLFLHDKKTNELYSRYAEGLEQPTEIRFPATGGIAGAVFMTGEVANIADPYQDARFNPEVDRRTGYTTRSILCLPIANKVGERIGVTQVLNKREGSFTPKDEARLRAFAAQIAICLENAKLFEEVINVKNYNESILRSTSNGHITLDTARRIVTANDAAVSLLKLDLARIVGLPASDVFAGPNSWVLESVDRVEKTGEKDISVDASLALPDGKNASVNLTVVQLIDVKGQHIGVMLIVEDITREKRLKSTMARYMSKEVADQLLAGGEAVLGGKELHVTILFSDVRDFTSFAETMGPRETVAILNQYFEEMVEVIFKHGGILDKYIGDALMAVFGVPFPGLRDADNAVAVANEMIVALRRINLARAAVGRPPLDVGVGVSTGDVVAGNIGSPKRMEYTVIGDSVNLASRLEGANKFYGTKVLISEHTVRDLKGRDRVLMREIDLIRVKGKDAPCAVFETLGHHTEETFPNLERLLEHYTLGLGKYRAGDFRGALACFERALEANAADGPSKIYLDRCRHCIANPPDDYWDGVFSLGNK